MRAFLIAVAVTSVVVVGDFLTNYDLESEVNVAKGRYENDFLLGVWYRSNEAIVESREKFLKLYTRYTLQQAEYVVEHIEKYSNFTQTEAADKRDKALASKNATRIMELVECLFNAEGNTIQAYKMTGYNLHNCIRMAQVETESRYLELIKNFQHIKNISLEMQNYFSKKTENCLDKICVLGSLTQSIVHYEKLQEEIATNVTEVNNVCTRYLLSHIGIGCIYNSLVQIEKNYNVGKELMEDCFLPKNETMLLEQPTGQSNQTIINDN